MQLKSLLGKFAVVDAPVLVLGESGVGKELVEKCDSPRESLCLSTVARSINTRE